jgi:hypothetical protein
MPLRADVGDALKSREIAKQCYMTIQQHQFQPHSSILYTTIFVMQ